MPRHPILSSRFFPGAEKPPNCAWGFSAPCKNASDGAVAATVPNMLLVWRCCCNGPQLATGEVTPRAGILLRLRDGDMSLRCLSHGPDEAGQFSCYSHGCHRGGLALVD